MRLLVLVFFALTCAAQMAGQEETVTVFGGTGNDLLRHCSAVGSLKTGDNVALNDLAKTKTSVGICLGYIAGVLDAYESLYAMGRLKANTPSQKLYCLPPKVEMTQLIRIVIKDLQDSPATLHLPAGGLVLVAVKSAFPCK
jgi:hypothetical protein